MQQVGRIAQGHLRGLLRDEAGAVTVEYTTVLVLVALGVAAALVAAAIPLIESYRFAQLVLSLPLP